MNTIDKPVYRITEQDVKDHAPVVYNLTMQYYKRLRLIEKASKNFDQVEKTIKRYEVDTGVLEMTEKTISDDGSLLFGKNPGHYYLDKSQMFRVSVIYHLALSNLMKENLSWEAFVHLKLMTEQSFFYEDSEDLGLDSKMLKAFGVDPSVLPKEYLASSMRIDEFNKAVKMIADVITEAKNYSDEFEDIDEYFEYMKLGMTKLTDLCNKHGFFNTHEIDRFTWLSLAFKFRFPAFDVLYNIADMAPEHTMPTKNLEVAVRSLVARIIDGDGDGDSIIDLEGDVD